MTSPDSKSTPNAESEGGGMLPALLAGAGILLVAGLLIFGGDDDEAKQASEAKKTNDASASAQTASGPKSGIAARPSDPANNTPPQAGPRLNPRIANAVVTDGMAPAPNKKPEPTSFPSSAEEIAYWEDQLRDANSALEQRQQASDHGATQEAKIRERGSAQDLAEFQTRLKVVADNLERAEARVAEVEDKLANLR
jgi:hypothetical protein